MGDKCIKQRDIKKRADKNAFFCIEKAAAPAISPNVVFNH
jgi:hypothetical protein